MDASPIKSLVSWLDLEARSIPRAEMADRSSRDLSDIKRRIAAGEYRLDADAIAEAMFGRADRAMAPADGGSEVLETGELDGPAGSVDHL
jgi:hypothetical protein